MENKDKTDTRKSTTDKSAERQNIPKEGQKPDEQKQKNS